jgi:hypothetical protein
VQAARRQRRERAERFFAVMGNSKDEWMNDER